MATLRLGLKFNVDKKFLAGTVLEIPEESSEIIPSIFVPSLRIVFREDCDVKAGEAVELGIDAETSHVLDIKRIPMERRLTFAERDFLDKMHKSFPNLSGYSFQELITLLGQSGIPVTLKTEFNECKDVQIEIYRSVEEILRSIPPAAG